MCYNYSCNYRKMNACVIVVYNKYIYRISICYVSNVIYLFVSIYEVKF